MSICAYCDNECSPSREHIIPDFLYRYQKGDGGHMGWNESAQKIVSGEAKIKDVCKPCNNGPLSDLDSYGKRFLTNAGVFIENFLLERRTVQYEYSSLLRWLLKISFNSARASRNKPKVLERYKAFILNGEDEARVLNEVFLFAGLVKPARFSNKEVEDYSDQLPISEDGLSNPFFVRLSWVPESSKSYIIRSVVIGGLVFHLMVFERELKIGFRRVHSRRWLKANKGMKLMSSSKSVITLNQTNRSFLDYINMQLMRENHFEAANKLLTRGLK
ncbi:hypothetical protein ACFOD1_07425 [Pseudidiomarina halophila]|nr:hypothetical protein [Pseudidiomarina halophila]